MGESIGVGVVAAYSNTSFALGPIRSGPSLANSLEELMALLPYRHEVDDRVYGGSYCFHCVVRDAQKVCVQVNKP